MSTHMGDVMTPEPWRDVSRRVVCILNQSDAHLGRLKPWMEKAGLDLVELCVDSFDLVDLELEDVAGIVSLGGEMGAHEEAAYPFLTQEIDVLSRAHARGIPILGVCLGGQLLAKALGAPARPDDRSELGWIDVTFATDDPLLGPPGVRPQLQWHYDSFETPAGARRIATSEGCSDQVFVAGSSYGVQFHPEASQELLSGWATTPKGRALLLASGVEPEELLAQGEALDESYERQAERIATGFADLVMRRRAASFR